MKMTDHTAWIIELLGLPQDVPSEDDRPHSMDYRIVGSTPGCPQ